MVEFTLHEVLIAAISQVTMKSKGKGIPIIHDAEGEMMNETFYGDSIRLQQVLADFLLASVNSTPSGGQLSIAAKFTKDQLGQSVHLVHLELRYYFRHISSHQFMHIGLNSGIFEKCSHGHMLTLNSKWL